MMRYFKKKADYKKRAHYIVLAMMMLLVATFSFGCGKEEEPVEVKEVAGVDDLEGATIGVQLGTTGDIYVTDYEGDEAGTKISRFNKGADAVQALK